MTEKPVECGCVIEGSPFDTPCGCYRDSSACEVQSLRTQLGIRFEALEHEIDIVNRVWTALGVATLEDANGKPVWELVKELRTQLEQQTKMTEASDLVGEVLSKDNDKLEAQLAERDADIRGYFAIRDAANAQLAQVKADRNLGREQVAILGAQLEQEREVTAYWKGETTEQNRISQSLRERLHALSYAHRDELEEKEREIADLKSERMKRQPCLHSLEKILPIKDSRGKPFRYKCTKCGYLLKIASGVQALAPETKEKQ